MNRIEWIALAWHAQLGAVAFDRLVRHFGSPRKACQASPHELRACKVPLTEEQIRRISQALEMVPEIAQELKLLEEEGVRVICAFEKPYPSVFRALKSKPAVLSISGVLDGIQDTPAVAIVGTRSPTPEGIALAHELGYRFARQGITVISGLARGIDTAAHWGTLEGEGRTIAVLGSGIRLIHPPQNRRLAQDIVRHGALVSELSPQARPTVGTLMARNRLQSALSNGVIVVESGKPGGALQTAAEAKRQGRLIFAVEWDTPRETNVGNRELLERGAVAVRGAEDCNMVVRLVRDHMVQGLGTKEEGKQPRQLSLFEGR
ncbi:MAG: DNA-processing protein DprA [Candidatus Zipacnadales bacterium]